MYLLAVLIAVVWTAVLLRFGGLLAGAVAVLLVGSCFGHPYFHADVGLVPLTFDRVLLAALGVATLIAWWRTPREQPAPGLSDGLLVGLLAVLALSTFTHDWSFAQCRPVAKLTFFFFAPAALYFVARTGALSERRLAGLLVGFAVFGVYLALTAVAETQSWTACIFPRYIASPRFEEFLGRGRGPFLNPIACGIYLSVGLAAACYLALGWFARRGAAPSRAHARMAMATLLVALVLCAGLLCTLTRSVWMGAYAAVVVSGTGLMARHRRVAWIATTGLLAVMAYAVGHEQLASFQRDRNVSAHDMAISAELRPILARVAWNMFRDRPLAGCGFGQYPRSAKFYLGDRSTTLPLERARRYEQHNVFLALLTETGLVGCGLFCWLLAVWVRSAWRLAQHPLATIWERNAARLVLVSLVVYSVNGMFHDLAIIPMVNMLLFLLAGVLVRIEWQVGRRGAAPAACDSCGTRTAAVNTWQLQDPVPC